MIQFTIARTDGLGDVRYGPEFVEMQMDLQVFLETLRDFPNMRWLGALGCYDSTEIEPKLLNQIVWELSELLRCLRSEPDRITAPNEVGTTSDEDTRMPFGNDGLEKWCESVLAVAKRAQDLDISMWARGN